MIYPAVAFHERLEKNIGCGHRAVKFLGYSDEGKAIDIVNAFPTRARANLWVVGSRVIEIEGVPPGPVQAI